MNAFAPLEIARRYLGKIRTLRDDIRTERQIRALSPSIRKDIGWPDAFVRRDDAMRR